MKSSQLPEFLQRTVNNKIALITKQQQTLCKTTTPPNSWEEEEEEEEEEEDKESTVYNEKCLGCNNGKIHPILSMHALIHYKQCAHHVAYNILKINIL